MLRLIHSFDIKPGVHAESFVEWLDSELWERSKPFGCLERSKACRPQRPQCSTLLGEGREVGTWNPRTERTTGFEPATSSLGSWRSTN